MAYAENLDQGFIWTKYEIADSNDSLSLPLHVLILDPRFYEFALLFHNEQGTEPKTAKQWCDRYGYEICFNAGMFAKDNERSLGYCRNYEYIINSHFNRHNSILAFNPLNPDDLPLRIIDRHCDNSDSLITCYNSLMQSIRMIGCAGGNVWNKSSKKHSILALATDSLNNLVLIFSQKPVSGHEFIDHILTLDLKIARMMFLEGGAHASLYINNDSLHVNMSGMIGNLFSAENMNLSLPLVIAARRKH